MWQGTVTAPIHSPDGDPTHVPSNSATEGEGITRTGGGSCSELPINMPWRRLYNTDECHLVQLGVPKKLCGLQPQDLFNQTTASHTLGVKGVYSINKLSIMRNCMQQSFTDYESCCHWVYNAKLFIMKLRQSESNDAYTPFISDDNALHLLICKQSWKATCSYHRHVTVSCLTQAQHST